MEENNSNNSPQAEVLEDKMQLVTIATDDGVNRLRTVSEPVAFCTADNSGKSYLNKDTQEVIQALKDYVVENDGLGMAAIQLNVAQRLFVMRMPFDSENIITVINPKIVRSLGNSRKKEGCFSIPAPDNMAGLVARPSQIWVNYTDEDGVEHKEEWLMGMTARVFMHEYDHLDGKLYIDNKLTQRGKFVSWART